jgi:CubicO group peptidase (beta-lactamase class C family)
MMKKILGIIAWFLFLKTAVSQPLYFPPIGGSTWATLPPESLNWCQNKIDSLYKYLEDNNTKAFIVLKDGKIVLEKYFGTHTSTSPWQWASAGKTITAFITGIAQEENKLSLSDKTSRYIGQGWTNCTQQQEDKITIWNQLTMTSGLDDQVADPFCTIDTCLIYKADAGTRWAYHNAPYTLLDSVLENAVGTTLNNYTAQKLKAPTGMTGQFVPVGYNNVFFSTARSMARFGLLMLNKGTWSGTPVMKDPVYFNQMINTSQQINPSYGYLWWLNGKTSHMLPSSQFVFSGTMNPEAPSDMYAAMGRDGQFLNVVPSQNLVWVRMGEAPDGLPVPYLLNNAIWAYINELSCTTTDIKQDVNAEFSVQMYPNPVHDELFLNADKQIERLSIIGSDGKLLRVLQTGTKRTNLAIGDLHPGLYFLKAELQGKEQRMLKFIKE